MRHAWRSFRRWPASTAAAILILALGIGATTAIFSAVNGVLLRPLDYADSSRLAVVLDDGQFPVASANFLDVREQSLGFADLHAAEAWGPNLTGVDRAERLTGARVTTGMFAMLGAQPRIGRLFTRGDERVVLLSHGLWTRRFAADPQIAGRAITLNGETYTIAGVMPSSFTFPPFWIAGAELWSPLNVTRPSRNGRSLRLFGRLRDGVTIEQARAEVAAISGRLLASYPDENRGLKLAVVSLHERVTGRVQVMFQVLLGASALVLLVVCANVANLLLVRATGRRKEMAIRAAIGAGRAMIVRQMLAESVALAAAGGVAGMVVAWAGVRAIVRFSPPDIPRAAEISIDPAAFGFAALASLATGLLFGLAPALRAARVDLNSALRDDTAGSTGARDGRRSRGWLIAAEAAFAVVLTTGAGLMVRSFLELGAVDPGFQSRGLLTMNVSVAGTVQSPVGRRLAFYDQVADRVRRIPGVTAASFINHVPIAGDRWGFSVVTEREPDRVASAAYRVVDAGYFSTMGIRVEEGRDFTTFDTQSAPAVAVVNRTLARRRWPNESAIGKRISLNSTPRSWITVAGVVGDVRQSALTEEPSEEFYVPLRQTAGYLGDPRPHLSEQGLVIRTQGDPLAIASAVFGEIRALEPNAPVSRVQSMEQVLDAQLARPRFLMLLITAFGATAWLLAAVGIYGVVSYSTARRTREIGIRMALGASRSEVGRMIVSQTARMVAPGIVAGVAIAAVLARSAAALLYGVTPADPVTLIAAPVAFALVALAAAMLPARRAASLDPAIALRKD